MSYHDVDPAEQVLRLSEAAGFLPEEMGGGCTALLKEYTVFVVLITQADDPTAIPTDPNLPVMVGKYDTEDLQPLGDAVIYADLATALDHLLTPTCKEEK